MSDMDQARGSTSQAAGGQPKAFRADARGARALAAAKALWWSGNRAAGQAMLQRRMDAEEGPHPRVTAPPPPARTLRAAWREAFEKDAADIAAGLYPLTETRPRAPAAAWRRAADVLRDAREVHARRVRAGGVEVRGEAGGAAYPAYYRQNFHFQSGGWFTAESAARYEAQVEALFSGAAGAMRRRALSLLARAWRGVDQRGLRVVDIACGSGAFLTDLKASFPRAEVIGLDLSPSYGVEARARSGSPVVQADAERLPFVDASLDAATCIFLFHELPPKVRVRVAAELARVLRPGGVLAFADSIQASDRPEFARLLQAFPTLFHEPFYASYQACDLNTLFAETGLHTETTDSAFLTKALLLRKPGMNAP